MTDIAALIERLEKRIAWNAKWEIDDRLDNDTNAALRAQAQEIERLKGIESDYLRRHKDACDRWERIRELEAERDEWKQCAEVEAGVRREFKELLEKAEAERDAIRRKTIEECLAKLPEDTPAYVCAALRALAKIVEDKATKRDP